MIGTLQRWWFRAFDSAGQSAGSAYDRKIASADIEQHAKARTGGKLERDSWESELDMRALGGDRLARLTSGILIEAADATGHVSVASLSWLSKKYFDAAFSAPPQLGDGFARQYQCHRVAEMLKECALEIVGGIKPGATEMLKIYEPESE